MRPYLPLCLALSLLLAALARPSRSDPAHPPTRIAALIRQLGHEDFARREEAAKALEAIGEPALGALRKATFDGDPEIRRRADRLVKIVMPDAMQSKAIGLKMVRILGGEFQMGSAPSDRTRKVDELQHRVRIGTPFFMGTYEVTQEEFLKVMKTNPSWFHAKGGGTVKVGTLDTTRFPVEQVSWYDALEFCNLLSRLDGYPPYYKIGDVRRDGKSILSARVDVVGGNGYRLPTEAEWEYACRASTITPFSFGPTARGSEANFKDLVSTGYGGPSETPGLGRTTKVGSYAANRWGLYDMHGNAAEWCWDWYERDYDVERRKVDPAGPKTGHHRILRGGSWLVTSSSSRSASRFWATPSERSYYAGFRIARTP